MQLFFETLIEIVGAILDVDRTRYRWLSLTVLALIVVTVAALVLFA